MLDQKRKLKSSARKLASSRAYYHAHREECLRYNKAWNERNKERRAAIVKERRRDPIVKKKQNEWRRRDRALNPDKVKKRESEYRKRNRELVREWNRDWYQRNKEKRAAYYAQWRQRPYAKIAHAARNRIRDMLKGMTRSAKTLEMVGCSALELVGHLETLFCPGMTWDNYGTMWQVDHIKACAEFDLTKEAEQRACFHYTNLQPLWKKENQIKGAYTGHKKRYGREYAIPA